MAYKEFLDSTKMSWRVWATYPTVGKVLSSGFEKGWLTFESDSDHRRLAPIPPGWEDLSDAGLRVLLKEAMPSRKTPDKESRVSPQPSELTGQS
jgi:hypothetical protein